MRAVEFGSISIETPCVAIVMFGPPTTTSGFRAAEYYQVTIDPSLCSPSGEYIRFGHFKGDEITGWQRVEAMTVCEILGEGEALVPEPPIKEIPEYEGAIEMRACG